MANDNLPLNQIAPAAKPVDSFIRPATPNVAAPAQPQMMPNPQGIRLIPQGSGGSVQGINQFQELAMALRPFSQGLVDLAGTGMQIYATREYEIGRSEAARAQVLANQQMLQSQAEYANENRKLAQTDPVGALMMDRVNPYRQAGRENQFSRTAGQEIQRAVLMKYRNTPGAYELPIDSPVLKQLEAQAVDEVTRKYRLNPGSPGFVEYVLPQIGQASQRLWETHVDAHTKHQKETAWRNSAAEAASIYLRARETGVVEWQEFDEATGRPVMRVAQLSQDRAGWERGLRVRIAQTADRLANETGLPGEASTLKREMLVRLSEIAELAGNTELKRILLTSDGGPAGKDGRRPSVSDLYGLEIFESSNKIGQSLWQQQQRQTDQGLQQFESELATLTYQMPDGPERGQQIGALVSKYESRGIPRGKLMESTARMSKTLDEVAGRSYDTAGTDSLLQDFQAREGSAWNAAAADREFESSLGGVAPQDRAAYRKQYADIRKSKEREKDDVPGHLVDPLIGGAIKSRLRQMYPQDVTEGALRGANVTDLLAWGDADVARSAQLQLTAYRKHVYSRLREAAAKKGAKLSADEITTVTSQALEEYGKNDAKSFNRLFPGSAESNEPSVGNRAKPPVPGAAGDKGRPAPEVYPSGQLDNMPERSTRLKTGEAVLALPSVQEEVGRVLNGQAPSAAVRRAARDAGFGGNVGRWLLREAGNYPAFSIPSDARQRLLRSSNDAQGMADSMRVASSAKGAVQTAGGWILDALMGAAPAVAAPTAATMSPLRVRAGGRNGAAPFVDSGKNSAAFRGLPDYGGLARVISLGEGGFNSYNTGTTASAGSMNLTGMTIGQVRQLQKQRRVSAVGFAQWMPNGQLDKAMNAAGLTPDDQFSPANQVRMFWGYVLRSNKQPALREYLWGRSNDLEAAHRAIADEWAGVQGPGGRGHYDGDSAGNRASVKAEQVRRALIAARRDISGR